MINNITLSGWEKISNYRVLEDGDIVHLDIPGKSPFLGCVNIDTDERGDAFATYIYPLDSTLSNLGPEQLRDSLLEGSSVDDPWILHRARNVKAK